MAALAPHADPVYTGAGFIFFAPGSAAKVADIIARAEQQKDELSGRNCKTLLLIREIGSISRNRDVAIVTIFSINLGGRPTYVSILAVRLWGSRAEVRRGGDLGGGDGGEGARETGRLRGGE